MYKPEFYVTVGFAASITATYKSIHFDSLLNGTEFVKGNQTL